MTAELLVAVDIGASKTLLAVRTLAELAGGRSTRGESPQRGGWSPRGPVSRTDSGIAPAALVEWVAAEVDRALAGQAADRARTVSPVKVAAVGVAAPGPLDAARGVVTRASNLGWDDVPIAAMLAERLGAPVSLEDDASTAALGEWRFGAGAGADPMAYVTVSSGVGGGIVVGGEIVRGAAGNAGEVGHIVIDPAGPRCACGRRGDVESFSGGAALARRARRTWPRATTSDGTRSPRSAEDVFRAARAGDPDAVSLVEDAGNALATAFAAMAAVVEPAVIVVGGSIGLGQRRLVSRAASLARRRVLRENAASLRVVPAALAQQSVLAGAADLALRLVGER